MDMINEIIDKTFLQNTVRDYLICLFILVGGFITVKILQVVIVRRLKKFAEKTATTIDDFLIRLINRVLLPLGYFGVFYLSVNTLTMDPLIKKIIDIPDAGCLEFARHFFIPRLIMLNTGKILNVLCEPKGTSAGTPFKTSICRLKQG